MRSFFKKILVNIVNSVDSGRSLKMQREVMEEVSRVAKENRGMSDIDLLIQSLFNMLKEEAPDSGAMCISLDGGGIVVAAESIERAFNVLEQCHDELNEDLTPGYYGAKIEA